MDESAIHVLRLHTFALPLLRLHQFVLKQLFITNGSMDLLGLLVYLWLLKDDLLIATSNSLGKYKFEFLKPTTTKMTFLALLQFLILSESRGWCRIALFVCI
ncbi:hypothetical protein L596_014939 [Steinernema carpocapsae]|uniref:Uncharacterized protein n=1 Tax=Steinernema carpocapsae TaxID=34508 RepID=A0A4U5NDF7_STECR|nr:hypothetical protein L596_014939 [Steinernema carpocapsae]